MLLRVLSVVPLVAALAACTGNESTGQVDPSSNGQGVQAKRAAGQVPAEPLHILRAFGTEPFWDVSVAGDKLTFTTPEDQVGQVMLGQRRALDEGVEISGNADGKAFVLTVTAGSCSDGMSDNAYVLKSVFKLGDITYQGCGEVAE